MNKKKGVYLGIAMVLLLGIFFILLSFFGNRVITGYAGETPSNHLIISCQGLQNVSLDLAGDYQLMNDIDCSGTDGYSGRVFEPLGNGVTMFTGTFEGNNHTIGGLFISRSKDYTGLFGAISSSAVIKNVGVVNMNVSGTTRVGGLVGANYGGTILNSYSTGNLYSSINVGGGLVGENAGFISKSYSNCDVKGNFYVGGLVGQNSGNISNSYFGGIVQGMQNYVGGLVGADFGNISNSYARGPLVRGGSFTGGFIGTNLGGTYLADFWDIQTVGSYNDSGNTPFDLVGVSANNTAILKTKSTFANLGWTFCEEEGIWAIDEGLSYPCLNWEHSGCGCNVECDCSGTSCESGNNGMKCDGCYWVNVSTTSEICGNGIDEDCNGVDLFCLELNLTNTFGNWTNFAGGVINLTEFNFSSLPINVSGIIPNISNSVKIGITSDFLNATNVSVEIWEKDEVSDDLVRGETQKLFGIIQSGILNLPWVVTKEDLLNSGYEEVYEFYFKLIFENGQEKSFEDKVLKVNILGHPLFNSSFEWTNYDLTSLVNLSTLEFENLNSTYSSSKNTFKIKVDNLVAYENSTVAFEIYELDNDHSDSIRVGEGNLSGIILNGSAIIPWRITREDISNAGNEDEYNFYFKAIFEDGTFAVFDENILEINFSKEFVNPFNCIENWNCGYFGSCTSLDNFWGTEREEIIYQCYALGIGSTDCGYKTRLCSDLNGCPTVENKPLEIEACSISSGTINTSTTLPGDDSKNGNNLESSFWIYFIIGFILVLIAIVVMVIIFRKKGNFM